MRLRSIVVLLASMAGYSNAAPTPEGPTALQQRASLQLFPNLIINVDKSNPGASSGAGYTAHMTPTVATVFSFDIPYDINPTCTLSFALPPPGGLFSYTVDGSGAITVSPIHGVVSSPTSYGAVAPLLGGSYGSFDAASHGGAIGVPCSAGTTLQVVLYLFNPINRQLLSVGDGTVEFFELQSPLTGLTLDVSY